MPKQLVISFDIDTHKCIRDGVPNLVKLANETGVKFTFFLNTGRSISVKESLKQLLGKTDGEVEAAAHMSAMQKLGKRDYLLAAIVNPKLRIYKKQIRELIDSGCEVGLHGGRNHALWACHSKDYSPEQIKAELKEAIDSIKKIDNRFAPKGFASPEWKSTDCLPGVLKELGFEYFRDNHGLDQEEIRYGKELPEMFVNLLGEPGGVAFFENERSNHRTTEEIVEDVLEAIQKHDTTVLYDHPYYAGGNEIETIRLIIECAKEQGIKIVTLGEVLRLN